MKLALLAFMSNILIQICDIKSMWPYWPSRSLKVYSGNYRFIKHPNFGILAFGTLLGYNISILDALTMLVDWPELILVLVLVFKMALKLHNELEFGF